MITFAIKGNWYDMIMDEIKLEEYREVNSYYQIRLDKYKEFDVDIKFRNGYNLANRAFIANVHVTIGHGNPEWGAEPGKNYFVLKINKIVGVENDNYNAKRYKSN